MNNVRLIRDRQTGMSKGFGYVNFDVRIFMFLVKYNIYFNSLIKSM